MEESPTQPAGSATIADFLGLAPPRADAAPRVHADAEQASQCLTQAGAAWSDPAAECWRILDDLDLPTLFADECPTFRYVPNGAKKALADVTESLVKFVLAAPRGTQLETRAWKLLLLRERMLLMAPLRPEKQRVRADAKLDKAREIRERVGKFQRGEWIPLLDECACTAAEWRRRRQRCTTARDETSLADEVVRKAMQE